LSRRVQCAHGNGLLPLTQRLFLNRPMHSPAMSGQDGGVIAAKERVKRSTSRFCKPLGICFSPRIWLTHSAVDSFEYIVSLVSNEEILNGTTVALQPVCCSRPFSRCRRVTNVFPSIHQKIGDCLRGGPFLMRTHGCVVRDLQTSKSRPPPYLAYRDRF